MGQKFAAYATDPGPVIGFYDSELSPVPAGEGAIEITDAEWQVAKQTPGFMIENGILVAPIAPTPAQLLTQAQSAQSAALYGACSSAITSGFTSNALGSACNYPSTLVDQANQNTVAACQAGGLLWCEEAGVWSFKEHTQSQAQAVVSSFTVWLNSCQQQLATLTAQIHAAPTIAAVASIAWMQPSNS